MKSLIVGQGIAGTLVAYQLLKAGESVMVVDDGNVDSSSRIAAGMFTPVSGKRMTLTPNANQLMEEAIETYLELQTYLGVQFVHLQAIYHAFASVKEQNDLASRMDNPLFASYVNIHPQKIECVDQPYGAFEVSRSGWLHMPTLLTAFREKLKVLNSLSEAAFKYNELVVSEEGLSYQNKLYDRVVFCEGIKIKDNPFFKDIEIIPCKGDVLTIECKQGPKDKIAKKGCYMVNTHDAIYRVGSTYHWGVDNLIPDQEGFDQLNGKLKELVNVDYKIISHKVGVRPTTKTREPILKQHNTYKNMFALNGLGTKGVLHAPVQVKKLMSVLNADGKSN